MSATDALPVVLRLAGRRVVVVGAGPVAARKIASLRVAEPDLVVIAPEATDDLAALAAEGALAWHQRRYAPGDLQGAWLVVAATGVTAHDDAVAADAERAGIWCVRTDGEGSAALAATVQRGPVQVAVTTGGAGPALAAALRRELASVVGEEWGVLAGLLGELRADPEVQRALADVPSDERARRWRSIITFDTLTMIRDGNVTGAREVARSCLLWSAD